MFPAGIRRSKTETSTDTPKADPPTGSPDLDRADNGRVDSNSDHL
jgi:hypothetical protein